MSDAALQFEKLLQAIRDPEYRYLLMEPMIFYGILFGVIAFLVSFFMRIDRFQTVALVLIGLAALSYVPYMKARSEAQPRIEQVYKKTSPSRVATFKENTSTWRDRRWVFYSLAGLAAATLLVGSRRNRLGMALAAGAVFLGLVAAKEALWLHYQDSVAYHPHLKQHDIPFQKKPKTSSRATAATKTTKKGDAPSPTNSSPASYAPAPAPSRPEPAPIQRDILPLSTRQPPRPPPSIPVTQPNGRIIQPPAPSSPAAGPTTYQAPRPTTVYQEPQSSGVYQPPRPYIP